MQITILWYENKVFKNNKTEYYQMKLKCIKYSRKIFNKLLQLITISFNLKVLYAAICELHWQPCFSNYFTANRFFYKYEVNVTQLTMYFKSYKMYILLTFYNFNSQISWQESRQSNDSYYNEIFPSLMSFNKHSVVSTASVWIKKWAIVVVASEWSFYLTMVKQTYKAD